jgi:acetolactate synthase I/III small subunit
MSKSLSAYSVENKKEKTEKHIMVVWVDNESGVLTRVAGLFSGRGYNIETLAVAQVDDAKHISRITITTEGTNSVIDQIKAQLLKLIPVHKVASFQINNKSILRELALVKIIGNKKNLEKAKKICNSFKTEYLDTTKSSFIVELNSTRSEIDRLIKELKPYGVASIARTGPLIMSKGSEITQINKGKIL